MKEVGQFLGEHWQEAVTTVTALFAFAYSQRQKDWIKARDNNECVAPFEHSCNQAEKPLEIHHIIGQLFASLRGVEDVDAAENGITLCQSGHDVIHPERRFVRSAWSALKSQGRNAYEEWSSRKRKAIEQGEIPWNDRHDRDMQLVALKNTQKFVSHKNPFPWSRKQKDRWFRD